MRRARKVPDDVGAAYGRVRTLHDGFEIELLVGAPVEHPVLLYGISGGWGRGISDDNSGGQQFR